MHTAATCPRALSSLTTLGVVLVAALGATSAPRHARAQDPPAQAQQGSVQLTKAPKLKKAVEAQYPAEALQKRVEGAVKLRLTIDANGKVVEVEVLESPGAGLGEAAKLAASQFEFEPAEINNVPAAVTLGFAINFELPILPASFKAQVLDATSGQGLAGVEVTLEYTGPEALEQPVGKRAVTDAQGQVVLDELPAGSYKVRLRLDEYRDLETSIELVAGKTSEADYKVEAQPLNFVGQVREAGTRKALPGVQVQVEDAQGKLVREGFTDASGEFGFRGLAPGKYRARIKSQGYLASAYEEQIARDQLTRVTYYAEAEFYDEYTAQTVAMRERREVSRQTVSLQETRRIPGTGGDVVRVIQNLPGVARAAFNSGLLVVRGANPRDTAVFVEGDQLPLIYHFLAGPAVINSEMIESIDFFPGNFSPYYGRATAGIIDLKTRAPREQGVHGFAKVDLLDAAVLIEAPLSDTVTFAASARRSYIDALLPLVIPQDSGFFIAPYYWDYQSWLTWRPSKDSLVELFAYGSRDELRITLGEVAGNENVQFTGITQEIEFHRAQLRWEWRPEANLRNTFMASFGVGLTGVGLGDQFGVEQTVWSVNIREDLEMKLHPTLKARVGLDMQALYSRFKAQIPSFGPPEPEDGPNPAEDGLDLDGFFSVIYPAVYGELEYSPTDAIKIMPGVRVDHYGTVKNTAFGPRLNARWDLSKRWAAKGGVGLFTQQPAEQTTFAGVGNPNLVSEKALHYAVGAEWRPLDYLELGATLFYRDMFDLVAGTSAFTIDPDTERPVYEFFNNDGLGRSYGAEFLIRHYPNNRFFGWLAYTLSRSERKNLITDRWETFEFDQTHILTAVAGYNLPWNIDVSARFQYVTGNPFTPIIGATYNADEDDYEPVRGERNSRRNAPFNRLDLRIDKRWVYEAWILGIYLDIQNTYNASNPEGVQYNYDFSQSQPVNGIPFLPTVGVNARF